MAAKRVDVRSRVDTPSRRVTYVMAVVVVSIVTPSDCGQFDRPAGSSDPVGAGTAASALNAACPWDPGFGTSSCYQGDWWLEFSVGDVTTTALQVEISGTPSSRLVNLPYGVALWGGGVKFAGGPGDGPVPAGTLIRLLATQAAAAGGKTAESGWFAYRQTTPAVDCQACTPSCAPDTCGSDSCNGTCACAGGAVCMSDLTCCHPNADPCGPDGCGGTHGPCACTPNCAGSQCGDDGCGGSCGSCAAGTTCSGGVCVTGCVAPWSPLWQQTDYAGSWWAEFQVAGGGSLPRSVSLEVVGQGTTALAFAYHKWTAGLSGVPSGTSVILHTTDATGATAQTLPFRYLVDKTPVTDPCKGTPSKSSSCQPLARGMVTLTMDDSYESQAMLARPVLAKYGFKATVYHITRQLQQYSVLPYAQALAADGHEIGDHTVTHPYLTTLTPEALDDELRLSKQYLLANVGSPVDSFASPMGAYDDAVIAAIKLYFTSHRTVNPGLNYVGSDVYQLGSDGVYSTSSPSSVCAMLTEAAVYRGWRILVFHDFTSAATADGSLTYPIADFDTILACAQSTPELSVVTTRQGVALLACATP